MTSPARVLAILHLFTEERPIWHTDEINDAMGYTRATGYRYVKDLVEAGFLQKVASGRYSLGSRIIELDYQLRRSDPLLLAAAPVLEALARKAKLDVVLSTMWGSRLIDTYRASADATLQLSYGRGRPRPLLVGASPKIILAHSPRAYLVKVHKEHAAEIAALGLGDSWAAFRAYLTDIRSRGYYWSQGELEPQVSACAVPLINEEGESTAAIALVGIKDALVDVGPERMLGWLQRAAAEIQLRLQPEKKLQSPV
jgi:DNA-binding IclR family transcriptional regulator